MTSYSKLLWRPSHSWYCASLGCARLFNPSGASLSLSLRGLCKVVECKNSIKRNSHNLTLKWTPKWQSCCSSGSRGGRGSSGSRGSLRHNQRALATIANQMASKVKAAAAADGTQQPRLQLAATCCNARARCIAKPVAVAARGVWARPNAIDHQLQLQLPQLHNAFAVTFCRLAPLGTVTQIDGRTYRETDRERQHTHSHTHCQATDKAHWQRSSRRRVDCLPFKASCALKSFVLGTQTKAKYLWRDDYYVIPTHTH